MRGDRPRVWRIFGGGASVPVDVGVVEVDVPRAELRGGDDAVQVAGRAVFPWQAV